MGYLVDVLLMVLAAAVAAATTLLALALAARLRTAHDPEWFRCRIGRSMRRPSRWAWRQDLPVHHWDRGVTRACWLDHVLLIQIGMLRLRTLAVAVHLPADTRLEPDAAGQLTRLGPNPQVLHLRTTDGRPLHVAVANSDRTRLVGPFFTVAIPGLPAAPRERRPRKP